MKKIFPIFIFVCVAVLAHPSPSAAQNQNIGIENIEISIPQPIGDFIDSLRNINIDNSWGNLSDISLDESVVSEKISEFNITDIWNQANDWMQATIGISISQIVRAIGNFIIWALELVVKLLRGGLDELGA